MHTKIWLIIGTMAIAITFNGSKWKDETTETVAFALPGGIEAIHPASGTDGDADGTATEKDPYHAALGISSDEELYDALYEGRTMAELAAGHGRDPQEVVLLQTAELAKQLEERVKSGSLSREAYLSHMAELDEILIRSVYGTV